MLLVTEQKHRFGRTQVIPFAGEVKISEEGTIELEDTIAQRVIDLEIGFTPVGSISKNVEANDLAKQTDESQKLEGTPAVTLSSMTVAQLQALAAPFPKEEWSTLKKAELIEYLNGKLQN